MKRLTGLFVMLAVFGVLAAMPGRAGAQETSSIVVQGFICPDEFDGPNWEAVCAPFADVETSVSLNATSFGYRETTADDGKASFDVAGVGPFVVEFGIPGDLANFVSFCEQFGTDEVLPIEGYDTNLMIVPLDPGTAVVCTFYVVPFDMRDEGTQPQTVEDIKTLPNAGTGMSEGDSGFAIVALLLGSVLLLAGLGLLTAREDLFDQR